MIQKKDQIILLVEDNTDDIELTLRAFDKSNIMNEVIVVRDGQEALDYLFVTGAHCGRDPMVMPHVVLLDLNLPKLDGLGVLRRIRADERTKLLPVVILTTSREEADIIGGYTMAGSASPEEYALAEARAKHAVIPHSIEWPLP